MKLFRRLDYASFANDFVSLVVDDKEIRLYFLEDDILRLRVSFNDEWRERSYSLDTVYWEDEFDDFFEGERKNKNAKQYEYSIIENKDYLISSGNLRVVVKKNPFIISINDKEGNCIYESIKDIGFLEDNNNRIKNRFKINQNDNSYGFGENNGDINKIGSKIILNPMDAMGYDPKNTKTLYKHIPFFIKIDGDTKIASGLFYHNTYKQYFDLGQEKSNYWNKYATYSTDGGDLDIFIINGPKVEDVIKRYTDLTGKSKMLPIQSLGYLASSMYYSELPKNCDEKIIDFIDKAKKYKIPVDGFQLSSGYCAQKTNEGEKRCVFTWSEDRFPDPINFFKEMEDRGILVSPNVKPGILLKHPDYGTFKENDMFLKDQNTGDPSIGTWWGGDGSFIDFTNSNTREQWKKTLDKNLLDYGVKSVWNDNCEYDGLFDDDAISYFEGEKSKIDRNRVIMSNIMCKITNEALEEKYSNSRAFTVCRSGHAGIQRYAQTWSGDNYTSWDSLKYNIQTILGMSVSGISNYGADVGGFYGPAPDEELFIRWVQNGIFYPRFSIHSTNTDNTVTEPWMYHESMNLIRDAIQLRYRLVPYYYSLMHESSISGLPILRPLFMQYQDDTQTYNEGSSFMVGDSLLVSNVLEKNQTKKIVYFPKGYNFYDLTTRKEYKGGRSYDIDVDISSIPMFIKEGGIIVSSLNQMFNLKQDCIEGIKITVANGKNNTFTYYEDDGESLDYRRGIYHKEKISLISGEKTFLEFRKQGDYESTIKKVEIDMINREKSPFFVEVDGSRLEQYLDKNDYENSELGWYYDHLTKSVRIKYEQIDKDYDVLISFEEFDLVGM